MVAVAPPYSAAQVKISHFPVAADGSVKLRAFLTALVQAASDTLNLEVFLQNEYLANGRDLVNPRLPEWRPQVGLGVWPDRPPPELWKISDLFRMARGERVPLMYQVSRITAGPKVSSQALSLLLGTGMTIAVLHCGSTDELLSGYKDTYLPTITQPNLRILPFYVPLLDLKSLQHSHPDDLPKWLGKARLYLRESPLDNAVLVVTDADLIQLIERAGAKRDGGL
ncbi:MAG: hypothetical protein ABSC08_06450, partial [Bryobacteraceae bacterium]